MRRSNRRSALKFTVIALSFGFVAYGLMQNSQRTVIASAFGPSPSYTDAPGENNCTACHTSFPVNSGKGSIAISGLPHDYQPGQQVQVTVTTSQNDAGLFGFQLTAVDSLGAAAGTFTLPSKGTPRMQIVSGFADGHLRQYVEHTVDGTIPTTPNFSVWTFTWTAPTTRVGRITFYAAGNAADGTGGTNNDFIYTTSKPTLSGSAISNFDGDFASDVAYFRPSTGTWFSYNIDSGASQSSIFGAGGDRIVPGDYDGDGKTDLALYRPSTAEWRIQQSTGGPLVLTWGSPGDIPVAGDYDGDRRTDQAIFRPATGTWLINRSTAGSQTLTLGQNGDKPVQGDYNADGKTDIGVYRPSDGTWTVILSTGGGFSAAFGPGSPQDKPVQGDYDGDGRTDIALFNPNNATWRVKKSSGGVMIVPFGTSADILAPADYDGDGKTDIAVFGARRKQTGGVWHILKSSDGTTFDLTLGQGRDVPVANGYLAQ
jgi:hypothetical protein